MLKLSFASLSVARCDTSPIVIVNVRLATLDDFGSPARVTYAALQAYYPGKAQANLVYIDAPYLITSCEASDAFKAAVDVAMESVDRYDMPRHVALGEVIDAAYRLPTARMLLFICTHSEAEHGDLFYAPQQSSASLHEVRTV